MLTIVQQRTVDRALDVLGGLYVREDLRATSPDAVKAFCQLNIAHLEYEVFGVLFLDNRHRLLQYQSMFRGTIDGASVHPREVAKAALLTNAAALIFTHNHPSGIVDPSQADRTITARLVDALGLIDVRVLDHIVVTHETTYSFADHGLL